MKLSELIIDYRNQHHLSQRRFAEICGLSNGYISIIEKESNPNTGEPLKPQLSSLRKIAFGMNMTLQELLAQADDLEIGISLSDFSPELVAAVLKSLHLEQYLREHGYLFADDLEDGDIPDEREYCYERATGKLWLLPAGKVRELEASIDRFTDFSIADLLRDAVEIPKTDPRYAAFPKD